MEGTYALSPASPITIASASETGDWRWRYVPSASGTYMMKAVLACGALGADCDAYNTDRVVAESWGGWSAGRMFGGTKQRYRINLAERENVSVGITDTNAGCSLAISVYAPASMAYFNQAPAGPRQPVMRWTTGGHSGPTASHGRTAGGSIQAMNAGEYLFDVQPVGGSTCSAYRIYFQRSTTQGPTWPTW
ncbi:MAG: hypothetical protein JNK72_02695 [Myxococcales bacterium]|nr:hypothetical protein [Myxococcales bacterium]